MTIRDGSHAVPTPGTGEHHAVGLAPTADWLHDAPLPERAFFLAAFAALADPASRSYDDRKRAEGKRHNTALICLAGRRADVLHAMLRTKTTYRLADTEPAQAALDKTPPLTGIGPTGAVSPAPELP